jgi:hypothetical protein
VPLAEEATTAPAPSYLSQAETYGLGMGPSQPGRGSRPAVHPWQSLGFRIIGTAPAFFDHPSTACMSGSAACESVPGSRRPQPLVSPALPEMPELEL